jgi:prepilin-type N-terminal cleavage/methylation domain-containing protein
VGFTLIELLVVLVIIPLIIGGLAEAFIVSFNNEAATSNRLSDSVNAQTTSEYFVRDVQGASFVTRFDNAVTIATTTTSLIAGHSYSAISMTPSIENLIPANSSLALVSGASTEPVETSSDASLGATTLSLSPFTATASFPVGTAVTYVYGFNSPEVCGPTPQGTFLVGFYHPPSASTTSATTSLDVGYWLDGTGSSAELDRYSCTVDATNSTYTATMPVKTVMASAPPGVSTGAQHETISSLADINPVWLDDQAETGWTPATAQTQVSEGTAVLLPQANIPVSSTYGFTVGTKSGVVCAPTATTTAMSGCTNSPATTPPITIETVAGPVQVSCTGFDLNYGPNQLPEFTGCTGGSGQAITNGSSVTQSSISGAQVSLTEPASNYRFSLLGSPTAGSAALASSISDQKGPTLLTLGSGGINPIHGGGGGTCPDGATANICLETGSVFIDGGGTAQCTGGGPHTYINVASGGTVGTVAPPGASSCNSVNVLTGPGIPNPLASLSCFSQAQFNSLPNGTVSSGVSLPGIWSTQLTGELVPGLYVVEAGIGSITGMAPDSGSTAGYYAGDPKAGVLLYNPGSGYGAMSGCQNLPGAAISGTIDKSLCGSCVALTPFDANQSASNFGTNLLNGMWYWQDQLNSNTMGTTGSTNGGLAYLPSGTFHIGGSGSLTTGSMIAGNIDLNGTPTLVLTGT